MAVYEYKTNIRYSDVNENNQLSDKGLLNILSEAAGVHSAVVGYGINNVETTQCTWMLLFWKIKFFKRPCWNTELLVKTWPRSFAKVSSWRDFEVYDTKGEKIAIATTEWVLIDAKKLSIKKIEENMAIEYGIVQKFAFEEEIQGKLKEPEVKQKNYEYTVGRRDIDVNHHMNNVIYLELAYDALPENTEIDFNNIEIFYKKQTKFRRKNCLFLF